MFLVHKVGDWDKKLRDLKVLFFKARRAQDTTARDQGTCDKA